MSGKRLVEYFLVAGVNDIHTVSEKEASAERTLTEHTLTENTSRGETVIHIVLKDAAPPP